MYLKKKGFHTRFNSIYKRFLIYKVTFFIETFLIHTTVVKIVLISSGYSRDAPNPTSVEFKTVSGFTGFHIDLTVFD